MRRLIVAVALLALVAGCSSSTTLGTPTTPTTTTAHPTGAGARAQSLAAQQQSTAPPLDGYAVSVPAIGVAGARLVPLGLNADHSIQVPPLSAPRELGVYSRGPLPGQAGPAVILGHVNANGAEGTFRHLEALKVGDEINTRAPGGQTTRFVVYRTATVPKDAFPTSQVYSDAPTPELRLITCGGALDRTAHNYLSNVIAWARKA